MNLVIAALVGLHGLIHAAGFAKAFGYAPGAALKPPISRGTGLLWLLAAGLFVAAAVTVVVAPRVWAWLALPALVLSQVLIVTAWQDARWGTLANALLT